LGEGIRNFKEGMHGAGQGPAQTTQVSPAQTTQVSPPPPPVSTPVTEEKK
jgi:hypothetical protein